MRTSALLLVLSIASFFAQPLLAADSFLIYAPSRSTSTLRIFEATPDEKGVELKLKSTAELGFPGGTITLDAEKRRLYIAAPRPDKDSGKASGAVVSLNNQGLVERTAGVTFAHGYSYLSLDRTRRFLLGAYYFGGQVDVYRLNDSGLPDAIVSQLDESRENAHCVWPSPDNKFVYIPYVKDTNALYQYSFDSESGKLAPLKPLNAMPPAGTGPRHMAYHPTLPIAYFSNEQHIGVSVYEKQASGQLKIRQVCDAIKSDESKQGISSSDILITPDARFVFAGIRGHQRDFDWVSRYRVKKDGQLELLGLTPAGKIPWGFTLSPDGGFLVVTAFQGGSVTVYRIGEDGSLKDAGSIETDKQITDVVTLFPAR